MYIRLKKSFQDKCLIGIDLSNPSYLPFYEPIIKILLTKKDYTIITFQKSIDNFPCFSRLFQSLIRKPLITISVDAHRFIKKKGHSRIQLFHGIASFGKVWGLEFITRNEAVFLTSPFMRDQLQYEPFRSEVKKRETRIYEVGYHKLDQLVTESRVFVPSKPNVVLYGPTWHTSFSSIFDWAKTVLEACATLNCRLIIKLHPYLYKVDDPISSGGIDWPSELRALALTQGIDIEIMSQYSNLSQIREVFEVADVLLSDSSSIAFEFALAQAKPVIFLGNKTKIPIGSSINKFKYYPEVLAQDMIGPRLIEKSQLIQTLSDFKSLEKYINNSRDIRSNFVYNFSKATKAAIEAIEKEKSILIK